MNLLNMKISKPSSLLLQLIHEEPIFPSESAYLVFLNHVYEMCEQGTAE